MHTSIHNGFGRATMGMTLIEIMVTISIAAILLAIGIPSFQDMIERGRVKALTEAVYSELQNAKGLALKGRQSESSDVRVTFKPATAGTDACFGMMRGGQGTSCDCTKNIDLDNLDGDECLIDGAEKRVVINGDTFPGAELADSGDITVVFDSIRGTATNNSITVQASTNESTQLRVRVSRLGNISICSPDNSVVGYDGC
jgi:type IV fimbrial biogenesis protein FimT